MIFTIDAQSNLIDYFRLTKQGNWRKLKGNIEPIINDDAIFETYDQANSWIKNHPTVFIADKEISTLYKSTSLFDPNDYNFDIIVHRKSKPRLFSKEEIRTTILNGDDSFNNSLVIDLEGNVKLIRLIDRTALSIEGVAVRNETYGAGNGYVGIELDPEQLDLLYRTCLEGWLFHLRTGEQQYLDLYTDDSEDDLLEEINVELDKI